MVRTHALRALPGSLLPVALLALALAGCNLTPTAVPSSSPSTRTTTIQGNVHGGQQPVAGASIKLYAAGAPSSGGGYGQGAVALTMASPVFSDNNGNFILTGDYTVPVTPSFFYIVATGGSPGFGNPANPDLVLMSVLGGCNPAAGLSSSLYILLNEVSTMATVTALQPFMAPPALGNVGTPMVGAPSTALVALENGFELAQNLANISAGAVVTPVNDWATSTANGARINTLADVLAYCVNSNPGDVNDTSCSTLFAYATPSSTFAAADTVQAAYYIAQNPTRNVNQIFGLVPASPPFVALNAAPVSYSVSVATFGSACQIPVNLLTAANFEALAGSTVTSTGNTVISGGNLGLSPGTSVTGFGPGVLTNPAVMHVNDPTAAQAQLDLTAAYIYTNNLAGGAVLPADVSGLVLTPGLYTTATTALISTSLTLDAQGDPNAVFIFQVGTALTTSAGSQLVLLNGAKPSNVFWATGTAANLGASSYFAGTIMAGSAITFANAITFQGRALAQTAALSFANDTVSNP